MATKYFVRDPKGVKHTRTTLNRTYTHAVLVRDSYEDAVRRAKEGDGYGPVYIKNFNFYVSIIAGTHPSLTPWERESDEAFAARKARAQAEAVSRLGDAKTPAEYFDAICAKALAAVESAKAQGKYDSYGVIGWCGRPDLAQKLAAKEKRNRHWDEVLIVEAQS